jgi:hypothetical protein
VFACTAFRRNRLFDSPGAGSVADRGTRVLASASGLAEAQAERGWPAPADIAPDVGLNLGEFEVDVAALAEGDLVDVDVAMRQLDELVDLLPGRVRTRSVSWLACSRCSHRWSPPIRAV